MPTPAEILAAFEEEAGEVDTPEDFESRRLRAFDDLLRCPICHSLMNVPVFLKNCNHSFCSTCVRGHYHKKNQCPLRYCSKEFSLSDIVPNIALEKIIQNYRGEDENNDTIGARDVILKLQKKSKKYKKMRNKKTIINKDKEASGSSSSDSSSSESSSSSSSCSSDGNSDNDEKEDDDFEVKIVPSNTNNNNKSSSYFQNNNNPSSTRRTKRSNSPVPESRLPPKVLSTMKLPALRKELKKNGLSSTGDKSVMIKRWERYQQLYNAELDSSTKRSISKIRKQIENEEKSKIRQEQIMKKSTKAPKKMLAKTNAGFNELVSDMRMKKKALSNMMDSNNNNNGGSANNNNSNDNDHATQYNNAWRSIYSERLGRKFYYNTVAHIGQWDEPELIVAHQSPSSSSSSSSSINNNHVNERTNLVNNNNNVNLSPPLPSTTLNNNKKKNKNKKNVVEKENSADEIIIVDDDDDDDDFDNTNKKSNSKRKSTTTSNNNKKRSRNAMETTTNNSSSGKATNKNISSKKKNTSSSTKKRKKKQRSIVGVLNDNKNASSSNSSSSSSSSNSNKSQEAECFICHVKGTEQWITHHVIKCMERMNSKEPTRQCSSQKA